MVAKHTFWGSAYLFTVSATLVIVQTVMMELQHLLAQQRAQTVDMTEGLQQHIQGAAHFVVQGRKGEDS